MQTTITKSVTFTGKGLHSGKPATLTIHPAPTGHGIVFRRIDLNGCNQLIPAHWDLAEHSPLCTKLVNDEGVSISTVEHVMAALSGCGIHNALIDIDGPEVPILDGSAAPFVRGIMARGTTDQGAALMAIEVLKEVSVTRGDATATLSPADALHIDFAIDFVDPAIGQQSKSLHMANGTFVRELCDSRTFCRMSDVDFMRQNGLALGGTMENAVVVDGDAVLSPGGMRHDDEPVRHKMLDALGDLALAGRPILGRYSGYKAGHTLTNLLLHALFADPSAYRYVACSPEQVAHLPGTDLHQSDLAAVA